MSSAFHPSLLLLVLSSWLLASCADTRPALTPAGAPDPSRRMLIKGWYVDPARPKEAAVLTFAYPEEAAFYYNQTIKLGHRLHQYRLDVIEPGIFPQLTLMDLDTGKPLVLKQEREIKGAQYTPEEASPPAPVPPAP
ncbi:MAG: hypothetical protein JWO94_3828 [Verrucomicrobiaceae bacterium]|nr:hypothetical protein [Verrucomicrobiaceae bacterium]